MTNPEVAVQAAPPQDEVGTKQIIFDALIEDENYNGIIPDTMEEFFSVMEDPETANIVHTALMEDEAYNTFIPDSTEWATIFGKKKEKTSLSVSGDGSSTDTPLEDLLDTIPSTEKPEFDLETVEGIKGSLKKELEFQQQESFDRITEDLQAELDAGNITEEEANAQREAQFTKHEDFLFEDADRQFIELTQELEERLGKDAIDTALLADSQVGAEGRFTESAPIQKTPEQLEEGKQAVIDQKEQKHKELFGEDVIKETNPLVTGGKSAYTVFAHQLPSTGHATIAASTGLLNKGTAAIREMFLIGKALTGGKPKFDPSKVRETFAEIDRNKRLAQGEILKVAKVFQDRGVEFTGDLVNSLEKAESPLDYLNWVFNAMGQAVGQIPLAVATMGASGAIQEVGSVYMDGITKIAEEKGITEQEVIEKGLDEPAIAMAYGLAAGSLEYIGAKGVMNSFSKSAFRKDITRRTLLVLEGGSKEALTEGMQTIIEQVGASVQAGKTQAEAWAEVDWSEVREAAAQGLVGGTTISSPALLKKSKAKPDTPAAPVEEVKKTPVKPTEPIVKKTEPVVKPAEPVKPVVEEDFDSESSDAKVTRNKDGKLEFKNKKGKTVSKATQRKVADERIAKLDEGVPWMAVEEGTEFADDQDYHRTVAKNSDSATEIAMAYEAANEAPLSPKEEAMNELTITKKDFAQYGDKNQMSPEIQKNFIDETSSPLDTQIEELSETLGVSVTEGDVIEHILTNQTKGKISAAKKETLSLLNERFKAKWGRALSPTVAKKLLADKAGVTPSLNTALENIDAANLTEEELVNLEKEINDNTYTLEEYEQAKNQIPKPVQKSTEESTAKSEGKAGVGTSAGKAGTTTPKVKPKSDDKQEDSKDEKSQDEGKPAPEEKSTPEKPSEGKPRPSSLTGVSPAALKDIVSLKKRANNQLGQQLLNRKESQPTHFLKNGTLSKKGKANEVTVAVFDAAVNSNTELAVAQANFDNAKPISVPKPIPTKKSVTIQDQINDLSRQIRELEPAARRLVRGVIDKVHQKKKQAPIKKGFEHLSGKVSDLKKQRKALREQLGSRGVIENDIATVDENAIIEPIGKPKKSKGLTETTYSFEAAGLKGTLQKIEVTGAPTLFTGTTEDGKLSGLHENAANVVKDLRRQQPRVRTQTGKPAREVQGSELQASIDRKIKELEKIKDEDGNGIIVRTETSEVSEKDGQTVRQLKIFLEDGKLATVIITTRGKAIEVDSKTKLPVATGKKKLKVPTRSVLTKFPQVMDVLNAEKQKPPKPPVKKKGKPTAKKKPVPAPPAVNLKLKGIEEDLNHSLNNQENAEIEVENAEEELANAKSGKTHLKSRDEYKKASKDEKTDMREQEQDEVDAAKEDLVQKKADLAEAKRDVKRDEKRFEKEVNKPAKKKPVTSESTERNFGKTDQMKSTKTTTDTELFPAEHPIQVAPLDGSVGFNPKKIAQMLRDFQAGGRIFGKVRFTRNPNKRRRGSLGNYTPSTARIATKNIKDVPTIVHEVGHALDDKYDLLGNIIEPETAQEIAATDELNRLAEFGSKPPAGVDGDEARVYVLGEGVAEFYKSMIFNPDATKEQFPASTELIWNKLSDADKAHFTEFSKEIRGWAGSNAKNKLASNIADIKSLNPFKRWANNWLNVPDFYMTSADNWSGEAMEAFSNFRPLLGIGKTIKPLAVFVHNRLLTGVWRGFQRQWVNSAYAFNKASNYVRKVTGEKPLAENDPKILARVLYGMHERYDDMLDNGLVDAKGNRIMDGGEAMTKNYLISPFDNTSAATIQKGMMDSSTLMVAERIIERFKAAVKTAIEGKINTKKLLLTERDDLSKSSIQASEDVYIIKTESRDPALTGTFKNKKQAKKALKLADKNNALDIIVAKADLRATLRAAQKTHGDKIVAGVGAGIYRDLDVAVDRIAEHRSEKITSPATARITEEGARRYRLYADKMLRYLVDRGRISRDQYDKVKEFNEYYVAMQRIQEVGLDGDIKVYKNTGIGKVGNAVNPIKNFKGSGKEMDNPYVSLVDNLYSITKEADRNNIIRAFVDPLTTERGMRDGKPIDFTDIAHEVGESGKNTITVYVEGEPKIYRFDEDIHRYLTGIGQTGYKLPAILTFMPKALRWTVTRSAPFAVKNRMRDFQSRLFLSTTATSKGLATERPAELWSKKKRATYRSLLAQFGGGQAGMLRDPTAYMKYESAYYAVMDKAIQEGVKKGTKFIAGRDLGKVWSAYVKGLDSFERATRLQEFRSAYKKAKAEGMDEYNAGLVAAYEARDLMDFAVAGEYMAVMNQLLPFTNARVRGLERAVKKIQKNPDSFAVRMALYSVIPAVGVRLMSAFYGDKEDEEEYLQIPAYQRDMFYNFKIFGQWIAIPKPFELGLGASAAERMVTHLIYKEKAENEPDSSKAKMYRLESERAFEGFDKEAAKAIAVFDDTSPFGIGGFGAVVEGVSNYVPFRGSTIISPYENGLNVGLRSTETASKAGKLLSNTIEKVTGAQTDPRKADHIIGSTMSYFGSAIVKMTKPESDLSFLPEDFSLETMKNVGKALSGITKRDPVFQARDVQWVLQTADAFKINTEGTQNLDNLIGTYFDMEKGEKQDSLGRAIRKFASGLRIVIEEGQLREGKLLDSNVRKISKGVKPDVDIKDLNEKFIPKN